MIIAHVIDSAGLYGAEAVVLALATEQRAHGHRPVLFSIGTPHSGKKDIERAAVQLGLAVRAVRMRPGLNPLGACRLAAAITRERADIIHSHGYKGDILLGFLPRSILGAPLVCTVHGYTALTGLNRRALYAWLDRQMLRHMDAVVLVHDRQRGQLGKVAGGMRCRVIENGLPAARLFAASAEDRGAVERLCHPRPVVGYVGRLSPEKGVLELIEAARLLRDRGGTFRLVLIGDGPLRLAVEKRIAEWHLDETVALCGFVAGAGDCLPFFDIFVLPSLTEGLPITLLEAMSSGLPVVASRVGAVPSLLDGGAGVGVTPGDSPALADAIQALLLDAGLRQRLSGAARAAASRYSAARMAEQYLALYREVLSRAGKRVGRHLPAAASP